MSYVPDVYAHLRGDPIWERHFGVIAGQVDPKAPFEAPVRSAHTPADPAHATPHPAGPGTVLAGWLATMGFPGCSGCYADAREMDELGPDVTLDKLEHFVERIHERAPLAPRAAIRLAIQQACRQAQEAQEGP